MSADHFFCPDVVHEHLRAHPEKLLGLRPWPELDGHIGECPVCHDSLVVARPAADLAVEAPPPTRRCAGCQVERAVNNCGYCASCVSATVDGILAELEERDPRWPFSAFPGAIGARQ